MVVPFDGGPIKQIMLVSFSVYGEPTDRNRTQFQFLTGVSPAQ